jgi:hypothetical protein
MNTQFLKTLLLLKTTLLIFLFSACQNSKEAELIQQMEQTLKKSSSLIAKENEAIRKRMNEKKMDAEYHEIVMRWKPKADSIVYINSKIFALIDSAEKLSASSQKEKELIELHNTILHLRRAALRVDDSQSLFSERGYHSNDYFPNPNQTAFLNEFLQLKNQQSYRASLSKIKNQCTVIENIVLNFCNNSSEFIWDYWEQFSILANQNTTHLKPGDPLEIMAGIGSFSRNSLAEFTINGQKIPLNEYSLAVYKEKAPSLLGEYRVPVKVVYVDQDGKKMTREFRITFIVD